MCLKEKCCFSMFDRRWYRQLPLSFAIRLSFFWTRSTSIAFVFYTPRGRSPSRYVYSPWSPLESLAAKAHIEHAGLHKTSGCGSLSGFWYPGRIWAAYFQSRIDRSGKPTKGDPHRKYTSATILTRQAIHDCAFGNCRKAREWIYGHLS